MCARHLRKGRLIAVTARLEPTSWKAADDSTRYGMEITDSTVDFLDRASRTTGPRWSPGSTPPRRQRVHEDEHWVV
jgi:single-stranded DNA-binding protein